MTAQKTCVICSNKDLRLKGLVGAHTLRECAACGLQFLDPLPDEKSLELIYDNYYKSWDLGSRQDEVSAMKSKTFEGYLKWFLPIVSSGRLLDIGCATGELLGLARSLGFDVYGVEISASGINRCRGLFGENRIKDHCLRMEDFPLSYFDVITMIDVLEHISDPHAFLGFLRNILKPEGIVVVVTPDTASLSKKVMGMKWPHYKVEHVYYYSRKNIARLFSKYFKMISLRRAKKTLNLRYCLSILNSYKYKGFIRDIFEFVHRLPGGRSGHNFKINLGEMFVIFKKNGP